MVQLNATQRGEVRAQIAAEFSSELEEIPVIESEMLAIVDAADVELETVETSTQAALVTGASTWMSANSTLLRRFLAATQDKRREVL